MELDAGAAGHASGWETTVLSLVDWRAGRVCGCLLEHQPDEPCPSRQKQAGRAWARQEHTAPILARLCQDCDHRPAWVMVEDDLRRGRPGAQHPMTDCSGCAFGLVGNVEEADKSLADALTPGPELLHVLRLRLAGRRHHA